MKRPPPPKFTPREPIDALNELAKFMGLYGFTIYESMNLLHKPQETVEPLLAQMVKRRMIVSANEQRRLGGPKLVPIYIPYDHAPLECSTCAR